MDIALMVELGRMGKGWEEEEEEDTVFPFSIFFGFLNLINVII